MRTSILRVSALALVLTPLAATGCSSGSSGGGSTAPQDYGVVQSSLSRNTNPAVAPADLQTLTTGNTEFALDLYHAIAGGSDEGNLFYSPYSVSIALAMTYAGAQGSTATQMAGALDFQLPLVTLNPAFDALDLQLASRAHGQAGDNGQPFKLNVIDSLWGDKTFTFQKPFLDTLATYYGSGLRTVDFVNAPEAARGAINGWVADQTDDLIPTLLPDQSITPDTRFVLVNAIYFNAGWATPFLASETRPGTFTRLDASTAQVPLMNGGLEGNYAKGAGWQAVELPYAGGQTSMVVVLPDVGQFATVETALDGAFVGSLFSSLKDAQIALTAEVHREGRDHQPQDRAGQARDDRRLRSQRGRLRGHRVREGVDRGRAAPGVRERRRERDAGRRGHGRHRHGGGGAGQRGDRRREPAVLRAHPRHPDRQRAVRRSDRRAVSLSATMKVPGPHRM